jgi:signal transduction histidine kinase
MLSLYGIDPKTAERHFDTWSAWRARVHPDDLPEAQQQALAALQERRPLSQEYRIVKPDGGLRWIETRADFLPDPAGNNVILSGISLDVTDRKLNEMELEQYRNELEQRVQQRTAELREAHDRLLAAERDQARQSERRHLLQEMHDGFGSQLATARLLLGQQQMTHEECSRLLGECLDDVRLLADTLSATESTLERALANYRFRLQHRLARHPVRLQWRIPTTSLPPLSERRILQLIRILQESLSNALTHAHASQIEIEVRHEPGKNLVLTISDDGLGLPETLRYGRGLGHMQSRARAIDARLEFIRLSPGTRIELTLPLEAG